MCMLTLTENDRLLKQYKDNIGKKRNVTKQQKNEKITQY